MLGTSPCPLLRLPVESLLYYNNSVSTSNPGARDNSRTFVPGQAMPHTSGPYPTPACADPYVHHVDEQPPIGGPDAAQPKSADLEPLPSLLDCLISDQHDSFLQVWHKLPKHLREISFDFHGPGWDPDVVTQLGNTLIEFDDVCSTSPTDFGSCSLLPFEILVPPESAPVASRPYRMNAFVSKQTDMILTSISLLASYSTPRRHRRALWSSYRRKPAGFGLLSTTKS